MISFPKLWLFAVGLILLSALALMMLLYLRSFRYSGISNFADCAAAGLPVTESSPRQCRTPDGSSFVEEIPTVSPSVCLDLCGNGTCEEIVCTAIGCPCPETPATCPQDCR